MYPLPVGDTTRVRYRSFPLVTVLLIVINVLVWFYVNVILSWRTTLIWPGESFNDGIVARLLFGTVPYAVQTQQGIGALSAITATFMHAPGILHVFGNMVFLWAFGRRIEDACGPARFLLFYLLAGLIASAASVFIRGGGAADRFIPGIGASGAIAGVMGAFLVLFPGTIITTVILLGVIPIPIRIPIPALIYLVWWLAQQVVPTLQIVQGSDPGYTTDFVAHLAGFFGGLLIFLFVRKDLLYRYFSGAKL